MALTTNFQEKRTPSEISLRKRLTDHSFFCIMVPMMKTGTDTFVSTETLVSAPHNWGVAAIIRPNYEGWRD